MNRIMILPIMALILAPSVSAANMGSMIGVGVLIILLLIVLGWLLSKASGKAGSRQSSAAPEQARDQGLSDLQRSIRNMQENLRNLEGRDTEILNNINSLEQRIGRNHEGLRDEIEQVRGQAERNYRFNRRVFGRVLGHINRIHTNLEAMENSRGEDSRGLNRALHGIRVGMSNLIRLQNHERDERIGELQRIEYQFRQLQDSIRNNHDIITINRREIDRLNRRIGGMRYELGRYRREIEQKLNDEIRRANALHQDAIRAESSKIISELKSMDARVSKLLQDRIGMLGLRVGALARRILSLEEEMKRLPDMKEIQEQIIDVKNRLISPEKIEEIRQEVENINSKIDPSRYHKILDEIRSDQQDSIRNITEQLATIDERDSQQLEKIDQLIESDKQNREYLQKMKRWMEQLQDRIVEGKDLSEDIRKIKEEIEKIREELTRKTEVEKMVKLPSVPALRFPDTGSAMVSAVHPKGKPQVSLENAEKSISQMKRVIDAINKNPIMRDFALHEFATKSFPPDTKRIFGYRNHVYYWHNIFEVYNLTSGFYSELTNNWARFATEVEYVWRIVKTKDQEFRAKYKKKRKSAFDISSDATKLIDAYFAIDPEKAKVFEQNMIYWQIVWCSVALGVYKFRQLRNKIARLQEEKKTMEDSLNKDREELGRLVGQFEKALKRRNLLAANLTWGEFRDIVEPVTKIRIKLEDIYTNLPEDRKKIADPDTYQLLLNVCKAIIHQNRGQLDKINGTYSSLLRIMKAVQEDLRKAINP